MSRRATTVAVTCLLAPLAAQADSARLDAICRAHLAADGSGFAVLVAKDGELLHRTAYGSADAAAKVPLRPDQPFYVASIAKAFTAACIADLARSGRLGLDDEVRKHVPELPECCRGITVRHLLHHRSGLRDFYELALLAGRTPAALTTRAVLEL